MVTTSVHVDDERWTSQPLVLWQRISRRIDEQMEVVERSVVLLLERSLRTEEIRACTEACALISRWVFSLDLDVAGRIVREIGDDLSADGLSSRAAAGLAAKIDDVRRVLRVSADEWLDRVPVHGHVHVVSKIDARIDAFMWHLRAAGVSVTHTTRFVGSPDGADAMVLFWPGDCRDASPALIEIGRRSEVTRRVLIHGPNESSRHLLSIASQSDLVLSIAEPTRSLAEEIRSVIQPLAAWADRVVAFGTRAHELYAFGFSVAELEDIEDVVHALALDRRTLLIGPEIADQAAVVSLVRATPATRHTVVAVIAHDALGASKCRRVGADIVVEDGASLEELSLHLRGLLDRRMGSRDLLGVGVAEIPTWSKTVVVFERALTSLARSSGIAALAMIEIPQGVSEANLQKIRDSIAREFRTVDLLGESDQGFLLVLLRGATREAAAARIHLALQNVQIETSPGRAGVAEFPIDGYSLGELMTSAVQAADRARHAEGPAVVPSDWYVETADQADVVIVESDRTLASILIQLLDQMGLRSTHVLTGSDALRMFSGGTRARLPKLILLELDAMGADGLMILRSLARHGVMSRTKVIVTCARIRDGELREAFELGADDVVVKPFSAVVLSNRIQQVMNDR